MSFDYDYTLRASPLTDLRRQAASMEACITRNRQYSEVLTQQGKLDDAAEMVKCVQWLTAKRAHLIAFITACEAATQSRVA